MRNTLLKITLSALVIAMSATFLTAQENNTTSGQDIYKKRCLGCHGSNGQVPAFGVSRKINELSLEEIADRLKTLSDKKLQGVGGASGTMHKQVVALNKPDFELVFKYISLYIAADKK